MADAIGHNSAKLQEFIDRLYERETEKRSVAVDIREIKGEAKDQGFNVMAISRIVAEKLRDSDKAAKEAQIAEAVDQYKLQLGLV